MDVLREMDLGLDGVFGLLVAALDHEVADHSVEGSAVPVAAFDLVDEVGFVEWGVFVEEELDVAEGGFEDDDSLLRLLGAAEEESGGCDGCEESVG